jgi:PAS domain S-box-containing protein
MDKLNKIYIGIGSAIMVFYILMHTFIMLDFIPLCKEIAIFNYVSIILFSIPAILFVRGFIRKGKESTKLNYYAKKLNETLIHQSHNQLFYEGNIIDGSKLLTKEVTVSTDTDRCSIWLYNEDKTEIICQQLYIKHEDKWYDNITLYKKDFEPYFNALIVDPIIIANDARTHQSTRCFTESYLIPLGINSMLDVPIYYKGIIIGVICIESFEPREWNKIEINFAQLLSSLFSFSYSAKESNDLSKTIFNKELELQNRMEAINRSSSVIEFEMDGSICFANNSFLNTMGYTMEEIKGKKHSLFVFDEYKNSKDYELFWEILRSGVFYSGEIVRKKKDGTPIHLSVTYNPIMNNNGKPYKVLKIARDITDIIESSNQIQKQNTYLEHAAKILRHDMHSGINTYIPRGISSLERRLSPEIIEENKLEAPLRMLKEGLKHTQKVYKGVYEFTNLVKKDAVLSKDYNNLKDILVNFLKSTAYYSQVKIDDLPNHEVNESLFCTAIDNLIRNGLKYNDSDNKMISIYMEDEETLVVQDNGRGLTQEQFEEYSKPYTRNKNQKEPGTGLGLNICIAILKEHKFDIICEKNEIGTKMKIKIKIK